MASHKRRRRRTQVGSQISEFAAALVILVGFVFIPLLDLMIVPIRWMLAQGIVNGYARRLALCETFRQSHATMEADPSLRTKLHRIGGVQVQSISLHLRIARVFRFSHPEEVLIVDHPGQVPAAWLPDGAKAPCSYSLEVDVHSLMSPAVLVPSSGLPIPGLTAPISFLVTASHEWENFGCNPVTGKYFLNE